jgi:hypothetical protein
MDNYFNHEVKMPLSKVFRWQYDKALYSEIFELLCPGCHYAVFTKHPGEEIVVIGSRSDVPSRIDEDWLGLQCGVKETFYINRKGIRSVIGDNYNLVISRLIGVCMTWEEIMELEVAGIIDFNVLDWRGCNSIQNVVDEVIREIDKEVSNE